MNLINDLKEDFRQLEISNRKLKQFAYLTGIILLILSVWYYFKHGNRSWTYVTVSISLILFAIALLKVKILTGVYKIWMGIAIVLGFFISRILISLIFFIGLTPISLLGRLLKKKWMDIDFNQKQDTYWIVKDHPDSVDYKKMY